MRLPESIQERFRRLRQNGFARYAQQFAEAGDRAPRRSEFSPVPYMLYSRSIELSLKAYLLLHGIALSQLGGRGFGHNLVRLLDQAVKLGLLDVVPLTATQRAHIQKAHKYYGTKGFEYFDALSEVLGRQSLPDLHVLGSTAHALAAKIGKHIAA
jgi:hypothetical protein